MSRALVVTGVVSAVLALLYLAEALRYPLGQAAQPGPGLYPLVVGAVLLIGATGIIVEETWRGSAGEVQWPTGGARWRLLAVIAAALAYIVLLPRVGHQFAGSLVTLVVLQVMGMRSWLLKIALAVAFGVGSYYLFAVLLRVPLPAGLWSW